MSVSLRKCKVEAIVDETEDAKSFHLSLGQDIDYRPGQFITLVLHIEGEAVSRSYSLSSIPEDKHGRITVKRVDGGKVSNYMCNQIRVGDILEYKGPDGVFCLPELDASTTRVFIGAGSGITPLMGMLRQSLANSSAPHLLYYGNKDERNVIFKDDLQKLEYDHRQLKVRHFFSGKNWLLSLLKRNKTYSPGRIEPEDVWYDVLDLEEKGEGANYFICGPNEMNEKMKQALIGYGIDEDHILVEYYSSVGGGEEGGEPSQAVVHLDDQEIELSVPTHFSILDALIAKGHNPPHSCTSGACCTCMAIIKEGEVKMNRSDALSKSEIKDGFILTCQAFPTTEKVVIDYDVY